MLNLQNCIEQVCHKATSFRPFEIDVYTLESAREQRLANLQLRINRPKPGEYAVTLVDAINGESEVALGPIYARAGMISKTAFAKTQYANVSDDAFFHILYDVQDRPFSYIENGAPVTKHTPGAPCMVCGLLLPLRNLTVDHQRPQAGGELEAVLKTFRAFGLTREGPKGGKGQRILQHVSQGIALSAVSPKLGRAPVQVGNLADRYTLTNEGAVLYSFIVAAGEREQLKSQCMHGLLNLQPMCQACNSSKGNALKF
ncbi:hypothetical protein [Jeongeupia chitinilytica]|uniref:HNH endonuclease n=1 Tax=Jeongeupia chitinilytica TaxID=1041641 RepID=A0ABQ3H6U2_9NEIS|nr:hypothetical protein [Jeongeupia chitinilytica]GHD70008.1 hypothetical protein GCM10007350_37460 [Jeongeupia chitinilytica]